MELFIAFAGVIVIMLVPFALFPLLAKQVPDEPEDK